jgi:hypothetical protein
MITVKNEMAQPINEQTIPTTGKIRYELKFLKMKEKTKGFCFPRRQLQKLYSSNVCFVRYSKKLGSAIFIF